MEQALIYIIIGIVYGVPLLSAGIAIYNCCIFKINKMAILLGVVFSLLNYTTLFFGVATISHNSDYSQYGELFSATYQIFTDYLNLGLIIFFVGFLIIQDNLSNPIKYFIYHIRYGIQIALLTFILIPDKYLAILFNHIGITDLALHIFAQLNHILVEQIDIKKDLVNIRYSYKSELTIILYLIINLFCVALPIIVRFFNYQLKRTNDE